MGSPAFAVYGLNALYQGGHEIKAVVTREDKARGRKKQLQPTPVKARSLELGIPVYTPSDVNDPAFIEILKETGAEVIVVAKIRIVICFSPGSYQYSWFVVASVPWRVSYECGTP